MFAGEKGINCQVATRFGVYGKLCVYVRVHIKTDLMLFFSSDQEMCCTGRVSVGERGSTFFLQ